MNTITIKIIIISIVIIGWSNAILLSQNNPIGMQFETESDSLFYVFNPESSSVNANFHQNFKIKFLLNKLESNNENYQKKALFLLSYKNNPRTINPITKILYDGNENIVKQAIHTLEKIEYPKSSIALGNKLLENDFEDKHISAYIIHALINLTYEEGIAFLTIYTSGQELEKDYQFKDLAIEGIDIISKYNQEKEEKEKLLKGLLKKKKWRKWALNKILQEENKRSWLSELRLYENNIEILIARKKIGDSTLTSKERELLDKISRRKNCL